MQPKKLLVAYKCYSFCVPERFGVVVAIRKESLGTMRDQLISPLIFPGHIIASTSYDRVRTLLSQEPQCNDVCALRVMGTTAPSTQAQNDPTLRLLKLSKSTWCNYPRSMRATPSAWPMASQLQSGRENTPHLGTRTVVIHVLPATRQFARALFSSARPLLLWLCQFLYGLTCLRFRHKCLTKLK